MVAVPGWTREIGDRISSLIDVLGGLKKSSIVAGTSDETLAHWRDGKTRPALFGMAELARAAGRDLNWLLGMNPGPARGGRESVVRLHAAGGTPAGIAIPVYDVNGVPLREPPSGGDDDAPCKVMVLDGSWLRRNCRVDPAVLALFPAGGESMEPTIHSDEMVLFDTSEQGRILSDGLFVIRIDGVVLVKRLQYLPGGAVRVSSDNSAYRAYTIQPEDKAGFGILGRVLLVLGVRPV